MVASKRFESVSPRARIALAAILVGIFYHAGARIGNILIFQPDYISVLWPSNAILLAVLLRTAPRLWPVFLAITIPAQLASDLPIGISLPIITGFILSNWIEVLTAAILLRMILNQGLHFQSLKNVIAYIGSAVLIAPFIAAFPGAFTNFVFGPAGGSGFWSHFSRWFLSDGLAHLTLTPTIYLWLNAISSRADGAADKGHTTELLVLFPSLFIAVFLALGIQSEATKSIPALLYTPLPVLLWAAVRFGPRCTFTASLFITVLAIVITWSGFGPFAHLGAAYSVLNLQFFLIISLTPLIVLAAVLEEQKVTNQKMQESEERIRQITDFLPQAVFELDRRGRITYFNRTGCALFGIDPAEIERGMLGVDLIVSGDREQAKANIKRLFQGELPGLNEYMALRKDGTTFPSLIRSSPIFRKGEITGIRGFIVDVSERKRMEEELRESEAKYRQIVQHAPAGIYEWDMVNQRYIDFNDVVCQLTGYSRTELSRLDPRDLFTPESRRLLEQLEQDAAAGDPNPGPVEYEIRTRDGQPLWVMVNYRFHYDGNIPKRATVVIHDITEKRKMETERRSLEERLYQSQKMESLGTLAGGIAHDFNNLLTGILGNVSLMRLDQSRNRYNPDRMSAIEDFVHRATNLTSQLLGLGRGGKYEVKPTDINQLIRNESELFGRTRKEIVMHTALDEGVGTVDVDKGQIEQSLLNLLVNAWQAMPEGGEIRVRTEEVHLDNPSVRPYGIRQGRYVRISVADTGVGMDKTTQQKIFDPFFTTKEKGRGTGLGLSSAYGIIKNHGGFIDVASSPGEGARFDIYLPVSGRPLPKEEKILEFPVRGKGTILLVDDEKMIRDVGQEMLTHLGYQVILAPDGQTGITVYEKERKRIGLVILDMIMPKFSGRQTFDRLKAINPDVRIILSSGYSEEGQAAEIMSRGCNGFIQKPFTLEQLSEKVRGIFNGNRL